MTRRLQTVLRLATVGMLAWAVLTELRKSREERTWQGRLAGVVPYDLRRPTLSRFRERWWNPDDERLLTPHVFGVGWSVNLARARHLLRDRGSSGAAGEASGAERAEETAAASAPPAVPGSASPAPSPSPAPPAGADEPAGAAPPAGAAASDQADPSASPPGQAPAETPGSPPEPPRPD